MKMKILFFLMIFLSSIQLCAMNDAERKKKEESELNKLFNDALADFEAAEEQAANELKKVLQKTNLLTDDTLFVQHVKSLVRAGASINTQDRLGRTALMIASQNPNTETVREFLNMGANPYIEDEVGLSAIFYAIHRDLLKNVELLLKRGVNIDHQYKYGETALTKAVMQGKTQIVKLLLDLEADKTLRNQLGQLALDIATKNKNQPIIDLLKVDRWSDQ